MKNLTIYDISEKAGVSIATVSRVLNGSHNVSDKTRDKVMSIIQEYDYTPNAFARGLGLNTMQTIGIMCADSSDLYLAKAIYYIEQFLRSHGYNSLLCCTGYEHDEKEKALNLLIQQKVDGIILIGSNFVYEDATDNQYIKEAASHIPVMLLNACLDLPNVYSFACDDYASMYQATKTMLRNQPKDILYCYNSNTYSGKHKLKAFCDVWKEYHPNTAPRTLFIEAFHEDIPRITEIISAYAKDYEPFYGIIAADDYLALGAVNYGHQSGRSIPDDLSIIGCNNSMLVNCCTPQLTSIDNRLEPLCNLLTESLIQLLSGEEILQKHLLSGELICRETTIF